ncbi:MAG: YbaB/EbfC family nucleoid-associated protein [Simkania negevensis]|nr:YbaB/EbfC family nucleoid-associated protein [Simkania negevensis]
MGSGYSKMKKQARVLQDQLAKMQEEREKLEVTGSAGNGLVTVTLNGDKELKKISIKPECVDPKDIEGLEDLILAACKDAASKIGEESSTSGLGGLSSGSLPFGL